MADTSPVEVLESEEELVRKAQLAISRCNWVVGECAAKWTRKFARGRTDADFAAQVGLSPDQVYQRRRVWETFGATFENFPELKWSHFYVALNWDDAGDCLEWAKENEATVAEMRAWRRALRGEEADEPVPADALTGDPSIGMVPTDPVPVRDVEEAGDEVGSIGVSEEDRDQEYAPFRKEAGSPAPGEDDRAAGREEPSAEQLIRRMTKTIERLNESLTPERCREWRGLPEKLRSPFVAAVGELGAKVSELM